MKKKILAIFIICLMIISLLPTIAFAKEFSGEGSGTKADPYMITTADELLELLNNPGTESYYKLANNIDMTGKTWTVGECYIPDFIVDYPTAGYQFLGTLDGNGKTISNISKTTTPTDSDNHDLLGLFGTIGEGGFIKDLTIDNLYLKGTNCVGAIAALNMGTITNCKVINSKIVSDEIKRVVSEPKTQTTAFAGGMSGAGGICGFNLGKIYFCSVDTVTNDRGGANLGGICGYNQGHIYACQSENINAINVDSRYKELIGTLYGGNIGGIAGENQTNELLWDAPQAVIEECINWSDLQSTSATGGICGYSQNGLVKNCINYGDITIATYEVGDYNPGYGTAGIVGDMWQTLTTYETEIIGCLNCGNVTGTTNVGGIVSSADNHGGGENLLLISDCLNQGSVTGENRVAGVVGKSDAKIESCFNTGNITQKGKYDGVNDYYLGGVAAVSNNGIDYCGNSGTVSSKITEGTPDNFNAIGGIAGFVFSSKVKHSYNIAPVICSLCEEEMKENGVMLGGIAGIAYTEQIEDSYFANDLPTEAKFGNGADSNSDTGMPKDDMRGLKAKDNMPGLFGDDTLFEICEDFQVGNIIYTTSPFISSAYMDRTTIATEKSRVPLTGHNNHLALWIILAGLSFAGLIALAIKLYTRNELD